MSWQRPRCGLAEKRYDHEKRVQERVIVEVVIIRAAVTGRVVAERVLVARTLWRRMIGLLDRSSLAAGEAMLFPRCHAIHTCFMRFPIDVVFLKTVQGSRFQVQGARGVVVKVVSQMKPFKFAAAWGADTVIELPAGAIAQAGLNTGELVDIT